MKNILILLSLFLGCMACSSSKDAYVVVENISGGAFAVEVLSRTNTSQYKSVLDAQNRPVVTLPNASLDSLYVMTMNGKCKIFCVEPGDTLFLAFGEEQRGLNSRLAYQGEVSVYNRYLEQWEKRMATAVPKTSFCFSMKNSDNCMRFMQPVEQAFSKENLEKVLQLESECLRDLEESGIKDKSFLEAQQIRIRHVCWYFNAYILMIADSNVGFEFPIDAWELLKPIDLSDVSLMDFWQLSPMLNNYFIGMRQFVGVDGAFDEYLALEVEKITHPEIREFFVLDQVCRLVQEGRLERLDAISAACQKYVTSNRGKEQYKELHAKILKQINEHPFNGKPTMDFAFEDQHGRTVKLDDFSGKYLLIDVWATWCGPCKKQTPYVHALEEELADKGLAVVSLSIDQESAKKTWREMVGNSDIALFGSHDYNTPFVRHYEIEYIPHFLLIAPDGTMLSSKARKPSDPLLRKLLIQLLSVQNQSN